MQARTFALWLLLALWVPVGLSIGLCIVVPIGVSATAAQAQEAESNVANAAASNAPIGASMEVKRIGLIDLDSVLRQSGGLEKVRQLLDEQRESFQQEFTVREKELQETERALMLEKELLSEEAFNLRRTSFEDEVAEVQRQIQYRRQSLDQAFQKAQSDLRGLALEIVKEVASERQLDLVLSQESALIFLPTLNISDEVLARLDDRTKNARIEIKVGKNE